MKKRSITISICIIEIIAGNSVVLPIFLIFDTLHPRDKYEAIFLKVYKFHQPPNDTPAASVRTFTL
jgi:hypothetical protein